MKRNLMMFATGFAVMLVAGVAAAQIGGWEPPDVGLFASDRPADSDDMALATVDGTADKEAAAKEAAAKEAAAKEAAEEEAAAKEAAAKEAAAKEAAEKEAAEKEAAEKEAAEKEAAAKEAAAKEAADTTPPEIEILHPKDGQVFEQSKVAYEGKTEPGARVFAGNYEADVDAEGNWRIVLILSPGKNASTFVAKDAAGNQSKASVTAVYDAPKEEPKDVAFTANQKFKETSEGYEKFWGTAKPGTKVTVTSEYGSAATEVYDSGEWLVKLHFDAPAGTTFAATVKDSEGHSKVFEIHVIEKAAKEFAAYQKFGTCAESPPYDIFYGTGKSGTVVEVGSKYGTGRTVIGEAGGWDMKVVFEGAPVGETFEVVLKTSEGHSKVFQFTRLEGEGEK